MMISTRMKGYVPLADIRGHCPVLDVERQPEENHLKAENLRLAAGRVILAGHFNVEPDWVPVDGRTTGWLQALSGQFCRSCQIDRTAHRFRTS
jgi:hypothetical protein